MKPFFSVMVMVFGFFAGIPSAYATHKDDPLLFMACVDKEAARAIVDTYAKSSKARENLWQFSERVRPIMQRCEFVGDHLSDLDEPVRALIKADTPVIWSGPLLPDPTGTWAYTSWHVETIMLNKGTKEEKTYHLVIAKKANAPK